MVLSCLYGYHAGDIPLDFWSQQETFNARSLPRMIAVAGIIASLSLILSPSPRTDWSQLTAQRWWPGALLVSLMSAYGMVIPLLGFVVSTVLFLGLAFMVLGERKPVRILAVSTPLAAGSWVLMDALGIHLPTGSWIMAAMGT